MPSGFKNASRRPLLSSTPPPNGTSAQMPTNEGHVPDEDPSEVGETTLIAQYPAVGREVYEMTTTRAQDPAYSYYESAPYDSVQNIPQRTSSTPQPVTYPPPPCPPHTGLMPINAYEPGTASNSPTQDARGSLPREGMQASNTTSQNAGAISTSPYKGAEEKGYRNSIHRRGRFRFKWPNAYQKARTYYARTFHHHRDIMQRGDEFPLGDYYLSPTDGHLAKLHVQCTQEIYDSTSNTTWRRTFIRNQSPLLLQASNFVLNTGVTDVHKMTAEEKCWVAAKWLPACGLIFLCHFIPAVIGGEVRNGGRYDPLRYKFWGYPYHAKNAIESRDRISDKETDTSTARSHSSGFTAREENPAAKDAFNPIADRPLEPETLIFLDQKGRGGSPRSVADWKREHPDEEFKYVFVSYCTQQFSYKTGKDESKIEKLFLHDVGEHAAKSFGVKAYWVGDSCLGATKEQRESTVWQISDIARGSAGLAIALSHHPGYKSSSNEDEAVLSDPIFLEWALRVWTLPEVILAGRDKDIQIYSQTRGVDKPIAHSRAKFATLWRDAPVSRELMEHYEGNLTLSPLELVTIALRCFHNRQTGIYLPGDMTYALMGLLRRRPKVVKTDTAFQAFARLSLANDSDSLLERLICTLPLTPLQPWYDMSDKWDAELWDIKPTTQVCGIGDGDTVIIDGAFAASIRWKSFAPVAKVKRESWKRLFCRSIFRSTALLFAIGVGCIAGGKFVPNSPTILIGIGVMYLVISLVFIILSPWIIQVLYTGKIWGSQAWFFGFEGYLDIETIENHIFGTKKGHLKWSTTGSPLSRHYENEFGECIGEDPTKDPATKAKVKAAINARSEDQRIFTLVDTYTLTVTLFEAARPPVAVLLCGEEGGMQRALLCSYDWRSQTLFRESVLRMETIVLEQMARVGRVRLGLMRSTV